MYESFSSLPPEEEHKFVVFEERTQKAERSANLIGWGLACTLAAITLLIVFAYWGPISHPGGEGAADPATAAAPK